MITLTDSATDQLKKIIEEENDSTLGLRVFVAGGGCSGFQYQMVLENEIRDGDEITELNGVKLYVDSFSQKYIDGAEIDFVNSLMGGGFTVHNPNAVSSCGCGSSFDTADGAGKASSRSCACS
ncbi:MAG: iron-sulfur cluster insertion protein ErpA [Chloroflexi bacterium]|jgi:iron-sulfur cluster assembly protein|uniref:Iron-sulfur cluster insertion protein ErpA n=1 Tax=Candidatus Chlorohelix allophototropha TaxID=3003348 RepID=A0A8T7M709_9CHLR|nr:iron-sulfur cluster insertion protein ErpA [Chloroflexota bacterium]WJW69708.1 iron-sulfur cluster insertion protein ErpA [Chloroflexota bacterium L227-S17]